MRLHVLGLPFSELTKDWSHCAFTDRTRTFCDMMSAEGFEVIAYGGEHHDLNERVSHVSLTTRDEQREWWPDYNPKTDVFNDFDPSGKGWQEFNSRCIEAVRERSEPGDVLCCTMGTSHKPVADALPGLLAVETGIGYSGIFAPYRVYESWAWRNYLTGRYGSDDTVRFYDTVIPRGYDLDDFPLGTGDGGYFAFVGRLTERKGPHVAALACERLGVPLVVAGQGTYDLPGDVTYVGTLDRDATAALMGSAYATFCPSLYLEPLCGVSIEAQLTGCPVIASNWGALVENVQEAETGFLCDTLAEFVNGAEMASVLDRPAIQKQAQQRWSMTVVGWQFHDYFDRLATLAGDGWYS